MTLRTLLFGRDLRYAFRSLRREPGITAFAIIIVGLGIGASSTVFNVFNALLLRPLPFHDPERLVWIANGTSDNLSAQTAQVMNAAALREESRSFDGIAGFSPFYGTGDIRLTNAGEPERVTGVPVTQDFFPLLGAQPQLGRVFTTEECQWNAAKTAMLSHAFWQRRFAGDPSIVGRSLTLDDAAVTIVGVLPSSFDFAGLFTPGGRADLFVPFPLSPETNRRGNTLALIGRLKPGTDVRAAQAEATVIGARIKSGRVEDFWRNGFQPQLSGLRDRVSGRFQSALTLLAGAVGFLMLVVCANLSTLLLARASARRREMAIRAALGAERHQLVRQMLVEACTLSLLGALVGLLVAVSCTRLVAGLEQTSIPLLYTVTVDGTALLFILFIAVLTGIAFGILPAFQGSRSGPHETLQQNSRNTFGTRNWTQRSIVVAEVAMVCVLLTGAVLLARSLTRVLDVELGFDPDNVIAVRVDPRRANTTRVMRNAYFDEVLRNVRELQGVRDVGLTDALPLGDNFGWRRWDASSPGFTDGQRHSPLVRMIDDGYLQAMNIPLRAGRGFTAADTDGSEPVIIVSEALAQAFWPGQDAIGRTVRSAGVQRKVIGVVGGVRYFGLERGAEAEMYMPLRQTGDYQVVDLVIRSGVSLPALSSSVRAALKQVDPNLPLVEFKTMQQLVGRSIFARRSIVFFVTGFALFALVLASLGIYAVISYSVEQRQPEIGLRMALGASPANLRRSVLTQTMALAGAGLVLGIPASWMSERMIQGLLFEVPFSDGLTFGVTIATLTVVSAVAGYIPARRASRIDPGVALRS